MYQMLRICAKCLQSQTLRKTNFNSSNSFLGLHCHWTQTQRTATMSHVLGNFLKNFRYASIFSLSRRGTEWSKAVSEAEKIVGYPTSFMSLRCLLSDELSNVAMQMRKLVGTKHPLLKTARRFVYDGQHSVQTRGLIVLLISKTAGPSPEQNLQNDILETMVSGIYPSQRSLAEITEMIHTAYLVHKGVVDLSALQPSDGLVSDMEFGNKMAVLSGDFLLANASTGLAQLYNTLVVEVMSSAIRDMMSAEFSPLRNSPSLALDGATVADWENTTFLSAGSLLGNSCRAAMLLSCQPEELQEKAYSFGKHVAFAHQLHEDLQPIVKPSEDLSCLCSASAPIILHLAEHPSDTNLRNLLKDKLNNHQQICHILISSGAVDKTRQLCQEHGQKALSALRAFQQSEARTALQNIISATVSI